MKKLFPVFRAGTYPQGNYKPADVKELFEKYDPDFLSAPFTTDHAKTGPAYGYAKVLKFENDTLFASTDDMAANLRDAVKDRHFRRVSIEVYKNLPEKKGRYLAAISFLGVKAPQVKGLEGELEQVEFKDAETEQIEFEVKWDGDEFELMQHPEKETGQEKETGAEEFEDLQSQIAALEAEKKELLDKFQDSEAERKQARERLEEISLGQRRMSFEQFLNERIAFGNLMPANKEKVMDLLLALDSVEKFDHQDASSDKQPVELFKEYLTSQPKLIETDPVTKEKETTTFASRAHELADKATKYREKQAEKGKVISFAEAVTHISTGIDQ